MPASKQLSFQAKLSSAFALLILIIVTAMGLVTFVQVKSSLTSLARADLAHNSATVKDILAMQNEINTRALRSDLTFFEKTISDRGFLSVDATASSAMTITNQVTHEQEKVTIPPLRLSVINLHYDTEIVDKITESTGAVATIFQVLPGKLLRVSTSVTTAQGKRARGTYIPSSSPVYQTVMQGKTYLGKAFVVDDWYLTAYKPVLDFEDNIVAVLFVGKKSFPPPCETHWITSRWVMASWWPLIPKTPSFIILIPNSRASPLIPWPWARPLRTPPPNPSPSPKTATAN
jgi:methyl-accepting chemotaxis protein